MTDFCAGESTRGRSRCPLRTRHPTD
jgi:hypothetical protein